MDIISAFSLIVSLGTAAALTLAAREHHRNTLRVRRLNARHVSANSDVQKRRMDLLEVRNRARLLEDTVKNGTSAVEKVHQAITSTTFSLIDRFSTSEEFRENARRARQTHDQTSQQIYRSVHTTNRALHLLADTLLIGKKEKKLSSRKNRKNEIDR